jgi:hypothetical protein
VFNAEGIDRPAAGTSLHTFPLESPSLIILFILNSAGSGNPAISFTSRAAFPLCVENLATVKSRCLADQKRPPALEMQEDV